MSGNAVAVGIVVILLATVYAIGLSETTTRVIYYGRHASIITTPTQALPTGAQTGARR